MQRRRRRYAPLKKEIAAAGMRMFEKAPSIYSATMISPPYMFHERMLSHISRYLMNGYYTLRQIIFIGRILLSILKIPRFYIWHYFEMLIRRNMPNLAAAIAIVAR